MAFDSTLPANHAPIVAAELRNQFNALADVCNELSDRIDAVPNNDGMTDRINDLSARNADSVVPLSLSLSSPPTQAQVQAILDKLNELITALRH